MQRTSFLSTLLCALLLPSHPTPAAASVFNAAAFGCDCTFADGMWRARDLPTGTNWVSLPGSPCQLVNLIEGFLHLRPLPALVTSTLQGTHSLEERPLDVFLFGDSITVSVLEWYCNLVNERNPGIQLNASSNAQVHGLRSGLTHCTVIGGTTGVRFWHAWHYGVHQDGPYFTSNQRAFTGNPSAHLREAKADLVARGVRPDIVLVASALWDGARAEEQERINTTFLPVEWVQGYSKNFTHMVLETRRTFPHAFVVAHTASCVDHAGDGGTPHNWGVGNQAWYGQMNAAVRRLARSLLLPIVDFELMSCNLGPDTYLRGDRHHPERFFMMEAINVVLNMYAQHIGCGGRQPVY